MLAGSGVGVPPPGTLTPAVVPNEKLKLLICDTLVNPAILNVNVADWFMNGLCGPFPAIEPLALL